MTAARQLEDIMTHPTDRVAAARAARVRADMQPITDALNRLRERLDLYEAQATDRAEQRVARAVLVALGHDEGAPVPPAEHEAEDARALVVAMADVERLLTVRVIELQPSSAVVEAPAPPACEPAPSSAPQVFVQDLEGNAGTNPIVVPLPPGTHVISEEEVAALPLAGEETGDGPRSPLVRMPPLSSIDVPGANVSHLVRPADCEMAERLLEEIAQLDMEQPHVRLGHVVQALAAEARELRDRIPAGHTLHWKFGQALRLLADRVQGLNFGHIRGLAPRAVGDWPRLARNSRRAIERFDRDAERGLPAPPSSRRSSGLTVTLGEKIGAALKTVATSHEWPALTALREAMKTRPLLLIGAGGMTERVANIQARFGVTVEWCPIPRDAPRQVDHVVLRIDHQKACACIIIEGLIAHKDSDRICRACRTSATPFAYGDKAGTASIKDAFDSLEAQLGRDRTP